MKEIIDLKFILSFIIILLLLSLIIVYHVKDNKISDLQFQLKLKTIELKKQKEFETFLVSFIKEIAYEYNSTNHELRQRIIWEESLKIQDTRIVSVTAYNAHVDQCDSTPYITAYNTRVRPGIVAVSRDLYELGWTYGKKVAVNDKIYTIEDLMGPNQVNQLDIFMWSEPEALEWGKKEMRATLLR